MSEVNLLETNILHDVLMAVSEEVETVAPFASDREAIIEF